MELVNINSLNLALALLRSALRDEADALANAREAVRTSGRGSPECLNAFRVAEAAHARCHAAAGEVRALRATTKHDTAAAIHS